LKRFVTYLYEYERGRKTRNVGFMKVDIRDTQVNMEICIRNYIRTTEVGKIYGLVKEENLLGLELGEIKVAGGQSNVRLIFPAKALADSDYTIHEIVGVAIRFRNNGYLATCWNDEDAEEVGRGEFALFQKTEAVMTEESMTVEEEALIQVAACPQKDFKTYCKIELDQIHKMPSANWHLCKNSFLVHGFFNYGYLLLKKEKEGNRQGLWLGVPGFFEKQELVMAVLFGFSEFEAVPQDVAGLKLGEESISYEIEKNQDPKTGIFGGWFVKLDE